MKFERVVAVLFLLFAFGFPAGAHTKSETQSIWRVEGSSVHVTFTVPNLEARRLSADNSIPNDQIIGAYIGEHVKVLHGENQCPSDGVRSLTAAPNFSRFESVFRCPDANGIVLASNAFFDLVPTHVTYAKIVPENGTFVSQLFSSDRRSLELSSASGQSELEDASFFEYVLLGMDHIFTGYDHQAFILALILLSSRIRDIVFVVTGFTLGHSISLSLAVTGVLRPHAEFIDSIIALTIAMVAAENMAHAAKRERSYALAFGGLLCLFVLASFFGIGNLPTPLIAGIGIFAVCYMMLSKHIQDAARLRLVVTLIFGTIHGFSFANSLIEMRLPTGRVAELLIGFNLGVEIGQLSVVALILLALAALAKVRLTLPRPLVVDVASAALVGLGFYWFLTKGYGA